MPNLFPKEYDETYGFLYLGSDGRLDGRCTSAGNFSTGSERRSGDSVDQSSADRAKLRDRAQGLLPAPSW